VSPTPRHAAGGRPGDRTVVVGAVVFAVGVLGAIATVVPFLLGREDAPLAATLTACLLPVGLGLALLGLLRGARSRRREARGR
jgi:VIT1/CCC1 family predicted Fe2+/Mn2+ transporter